MSGEEGIISLVSVGVDVPLAELCDGFVFEEDDTA